MISELDETAAGESKALDALVVDCLTRQGKNSVWKVDFISSAEAERAIRRAFALAVSTEVAALEEIAVATLASMESQIHQSIIAAQSWIKPKPKGDDR